MINFFKKHWEVLSYLVFGVLCTLLNIVLYALFNKLFGYTAANSWGNVLDNIICILFAYCTNRAFVFRSKTQGKAMAREFGAFVTCRLGTMLLDTAIMLVLGNLLAAQGAALMDELMQGVLSVVAHWLGPDTAIQMAASYAGTPAGVTDGSAAIAVIGGADGPTAIFVTSRYNAQALWGLAVKVFSNVLVIVLNPLSRLTATALPKGELFCRRRKTSPPSIKLPHSGELASSVCEMTERVLQIINTLGGTVL